MCSPSSLGGNPYCSKIESNLKASVCRFNKTSPPLSSNNHLLKSLYIHTYRSNVLLQETVWTHLQNYKDGSHHYGLCLDNEPELVINSSFGPILWNVVVNIVLLFAQIEDFNYKKETKTQPPWVNQRNSRGNREVMPIWDLAF